MPMTKRLLLALPMIMLLVSSPIAQEMSPERPGMPWLVLRAMQESYPDKISSYDYDEEIADWFLTGGKIRLYWAHGRLLPKEEIQNWEKWQPLVDYDYPAAIPDPSTFSADLIRRLDPDALASRRSNGPVQHSAYFDILYDGVTRVRIESHITRVDYLGKRVSVHSDIITPLKKVESRLRETALSDPEVAAFLSSILSIEGYNWREIADSPSRSNHSWGIALDILPKNWGQKNIYWNWVSNWNDKWMLIPLERRWMPPQAVIAIFEAEGFIWGGKWHLWDNMHFEYRPELLLLQRWGYEGGIY